METDSASGDVESPHGGLGPGEPSVERILEDAVGQQQGWLRVYGKGLRVYVSAMFLLNDLTAVTTGFLDTRRGHRPAAAGSPSGGGGVTVRRGGVTVRRRRGHRPAGWGHRPAGAGSPSGGGGVTVRRGHRPAAAGSPSGGVTVRRGRGHRPAGAGSPSGGGGVTVRRRGGVTVRRGGVTVRRGRGHRPAGAGSPSGGGVGSPSGGVGSPSGGGGSPSGGGGVTVRRRRGRGFQCDAGGEGGESSGLLMSSVPSLLLHLLGAAGPNNWDHFTPGGQMKGHR
ncbi:hypothetical protein NHX12_004557, partial [Muraenolepis orangiensis]